MGKKLYLKGISLLLCIALAGCANDQQRTKTQGAVIGTVGGAIVGGGLGLLVGVLSGNRNDIGRFVIAGAAAGAAIGGVAGYKWGERVAFKKEQYKTAEDRLRANIARADAVRAAADQENKQLRSDIAQYQQQLQQMSSDAAAGRDVSQTRASLADTLSKRRQDVAHKLNCCNQEIVDRKQALAEDQDDGNPQQIADLKTKISQLSQEREQMEQENNQLAEISPRIGV
jgi:hypothetical protein